jgi:hypothetical protein
MIGKSPGEPLAIFTSFTRQWFRLLSQGLFQQAVSCLDEPNSYGELWSEKQIRDVLLDYTNSAAAVVIDPDLLKGDGEPHLGEFNDGSGFWFEMNLPLNGGWSDLTVKFEFKHRSNKFAVILHDIHVL